MLPKYEKTPGSLWKYQGNFVTVVEQNGSLIRIKTDCPDEGSFLVSPDKLNPVSTQAFRDYVRKHTRKV